MTLGNCNEDYISFSIIIKPNENSLLVLSTTNKPLSQMFCFPSFYYIENHTKMSFFTTSTKQSNSMNLAKFEILKKYLPRTDVVEVGQIPDSNLMTVAGGEEQFVVWAKCQGRVSF